MSFWKFVKTELIDIIEWVKPEPDQMMFKFQRHDNEIKNGAKLIVRESQVAALVNEGRLADIYFPGTHTLETRNMPLLSTLAGWKYGFNSPFKVDVYFVSLKTFTDRKWGTKNPIMLRDADFGMVRLRAFGSFAIRVSDPATFLKNAVGVACRFNVDDVGTQLRDMVVARFADILGESKIPALDLASSYDELGKFVSERIHDDFGHFGLEVVRLVVENISLPPEVEAAMDKRTQMGVLGNLDQYTKFQAANALENASKNPGGAGSDMMGAGMGVAMGLAMANQMAGAMNPGAAAAQPTGGHAAPPPLPSAGFFLALGGQQVGPLDVAAIQQRVMAGQVSRETLVWRQGMPNWTAAGQVPELAGVFSTLPPPLPPPIG